MIRDISEPHIGLLHLTKKFPGIWKSIEPAIKLRFTKYKSEVNKECFLPLPIWVHFIDKIYPEKVSDEIFITTNTPILATIGAWRYTKNIYDYEYTLQEHLLNTPFESTIPMDILVRIPNYSIYVRLNNIRDVYGVWFSLPDSAEGTPFKRAIIMVLHCRSEENPEEPNFIQLTMPITDGKFTIDDCYDANINYLKENKIYPEGGEEIIEELKNMAKRFINLLLYICSFEPDIIDKNPNVVRHAFALDIDKSKGKFKLLQAKNTKHYMVGENIGKVLKEQERYYIPSHGKMRPHIRRAHWHGYWTGSKDERSYTLKWLPPMAIATTNGYKEKFTGVANG